MNEQSSNKDKKPNFEANKGEKLKELKDSDVRTAIGGKLLDYKKRLKSKSSVLYSVDESDIHRKEVDEIYNSIKEMPTRLLDGRLYNFFILMQKKRDLLFLQDKSSRDDRVKRLARFMFRLSTPVLFLNHNHHIEINYPLKVEYTKVNQSLIINRKDFVQSTDAINPLMTQEELKRTRQILKAKLLNKKTWSESELNSDLNHSEADLLSQILSSDDELIMIYTNKRINFFSESNGKLTNKSLKSFVFMFKPNK
ncbi:MAG: hypothetical protein HeimC3_51760 [Candidatus Heimdallarchaeota archaeon LC_3]|nr:MAG: hypothetical protein HeimC3_51760 [Candidatus Heimdallarchaeota archaeon LC_3]